MEVVGLRGGGGGSGGGGGRGVAARFRLFTKQS